MINRYVPVSNSYLPTYLGMYVQYAQYRVTDCAVSHWYSI